MKNTLSDLNNYLFEALERINDDSLSEEQLQMEITRSHAVTSVAEVIVRNGALALKAAQYAEECGIGIKNNENRKMPAMLEAGS